LTAGEPGELDLGQGSASDQFKDTNGRPPDHTNGRPPDHTNGRPPDHTNGRPPDHRTTPERLSEATWTLMLALSK